MLVKGSTYFKIRVIFETVGVDFIFFRHDVVARAKESGDSWCSPVVQQSDRKNRWAAEEK